MKQPTQMSMMTMLSGVLGFSLRFQTDGAKGRIGSRKTTTQVLGCVSRDKSSCDSTAVSWKTRGAPNYKSVRSSSADTVCLHSPMMVALEAKADESNLSAVKYVGYRS
jgi:hypothetical protein